MAMGGRMKLGVLGGTFDPIHKAHLAVAEEVRIRLGLAEILFIPAGRPWLKAGSPISAAEHRLEMVRLAIADKAYFKLSTLEIERAGPSYTVDTIVELKRQRADDELFSILGWDNFDQLPQWREPGRLITMCQLVVVPRPGYPVPDPERLEAIIPGLTQKVILMEKPEMDISAEEIRQRVTCGLPISHLVPGPIDRYIKQHQLYK